MPSETIIARAACIGAGVIGAGWVARLLLSGIDVALFDPDPQAGRKIEAVLANATHAWQRLLPQPLPPAGRLTFATSIAAAVRDADFIQESVPERLDLKRRILAEIEADARPDALIGSSTSGLLPSDMQAGMREPGRLVVAHPFNPVYLLPLVEIVGGKATTKEAIARAGAIYRGIGMRPVVLRREIEAFVGDRLLEALWREALWLVHDDIASVEEIDDIIRFSFGLRWAQMGLFQTYRIAGGEAGMRHFLAQFGPCLAWPWTKLTDVPDLDEALIDKIAAQSDAQANGLSVRALERIRDDNLVGIMKALAAQNEGRGWGAGQEVRALEALLAARRPVPPSPSPSDVPLPLLAATVEPDWIDYNGHMTEHRYLQVLGEATDAFLRLIGVDKAYVAGGHSYYTVESHLTHKGQARAGDQLTTTTQVVGSDPKRLHLFHKVSNAVTGELLATGEHMLLHVDSGAAKAVPVEGAVAERLAAYATAHAALQKECPIGRHVGQRTG
ncbi:carnitine 3-dehydrogenase [Arboricoccus pini]|uniref:L-carnitine dehydrogenase n=1 Tax=Arboricoccus pini TaxID=1963835 RepID=A0A212RNI3_9PROT|nr:carnitine 3-dehydrogenase [Arboricoccus pini]SNB74079.1 carnitine 3-dehydrogenase [Arboricoccus pini]